MRAVMKELAIAQGRFRHFSLQEGLLNQESISIVVDHKTVIILPFLTPPKGFVHTRILNKINGDIPYYFYSLAGKIFESRGNISYTTLGLTPRGFADPSAFEQLTAAVNSGSYWQRMHPYFESEVYSGTYSIGPSTKIECAFLLPQFAYAINGQPVADQAALFVEKRAIMEVPSVFQLG